MDKTDNWVDFKDLKERITFEMVLKRYGILGRLKKSGRNLVGCCPIHRGTNPRQFSVNPERNVFNCFGNCHSGGNVLDFVAKMENIAVRDAALKLKEWFREAEPAKTKAPAAKINPERRKKGEKDEPGRREEAAAGMAEPVLEEAPGKEKGTRDGEERPKDRAEEAEKPAAINPPLNFQLKSLNPQHAFFAERGILPATAEYFGLGFCSKGMMKGRIAIPIHNEHGELVAYCGRAADPVQAEAEGKYKLPPNFVKSAVVYNLHRQTPPTQALVLVESFLSVFRLYQAGYTNAVSLLGSALSERQEELILERLAAGGRLYLMFDADDSGQNCTADCLRRLGYCAFVKAVDIGRLAKKPHLLSPDALKALLS
jgi:DNA primase